VRMCVRVSAPRYGACVHATGKYRMLSPTRGFSPHNLARSLPGGPAALENGKKQGWRQAGGRLIVACVARDASDVRVSDQRCVAC